MIIVTGGAGFIGSAIVWALNQAGEKDILVVDRLGSGDKWRNLVNLAFAAYLDKDDFLEMVRTNTLPHRPKAIVHMGACSSTTEKDADYLMRNNLHYSQELCRYAMKVGARFIYASSAATYGNGSQGFADCEEGVGALRPLNMYGFSKQLFDRWAIEENYMSHIVGLKFFNVYGPNEYHKNNMRSMVCKAYAEIKQTGRIKLFKSNDPAYPDGGQMRDFIYVKDCAATILNLLENNKICGLFNLGTGAAKTWNDLANAVFAALGQAVAIDYMDMPTELQGQYQNFTQAKMEKLAAAGLNLASFHSLEDGVHDYVQNYLMRSDPYLGN